MSRRRRIYWHLRLGHIGPEKLRKTASHVLGMRLVPGLKNRIHCVACDETKVKRGKIQKGIIPRPQDPKKNSRTLQNEAEKKNKRNMWGRLEGGNQVPTRIKVLYYFDPRKVPLIPEAPGPSGFDSHIQEPTPIGDNDQPNERPAQAESNSRRSSSRENRGAPPAREDFLGSITSKQDSSQPEPSPPDSQPTRSTGGTQVDLKGFFLAKIEDIPTGFEDAITRSEKELRKRSIAERL